MFLSAMQSTFLKIYINTDRFLHNSTMSMQDFTQVSLSPFTNSINSMKIINEEEEEEVKN